MSIPAGPTFDAFSSLIDPSNPFKSSGIQSPFHCAQCLKFRAVACGKMGHHAGCCFQYRGEAGLTKSPVLFFLTQANRIRAGKSSVLIHRTLTLSVLLST